MTSESLLELSPELVKVKDGRFREDIDLHELEMLKKSILKLGQIQPIVVTREMELVVGERRLTACRELNREVTAIYVDQVDELLLREMELHENLYRANLTPAETVLAKQEIHNIWQSQEGDPMDPTSLMARVTHRQIQQGS
jgi:ParB family chromosome partitioning protein